ncbi:MAG: glycerate kinase [Saprospiraceae bacterium]|nr:glycerate kinase [Saprospiraceae bacterium]
MNILIAADSFKDGLGATAVCAAIAAGIRRVRPQDQIRTFPLADGGEGTMDILLHHLQGQRISVKVHDPLFRVIDAQYGLSADGKTAIVEMAQASGLQLLLPTERRATQTTTLGTGELIKDASDRGCEKLILAIGGSATNDGGIGMATALGYKFLDKSGNPVIPVGASLSAIDQLDARGVHSALKQLEVSVICDVNNPLTGGRGASNTYGPQKGASPEEVLLLEKGMIHYAQIIEKHFGKTIASIPGAGAAGGMGAASLAYLNARLRPGVELVMDLCGFEEALQGVNLIFTGEGRIDAQTLHGKLIKGICTLAAKQQIPVIGLCGSLGADPEMIRKIGLLAAFSITPGPMTLEEALKQTAQNLEITASQVRLAALGF